jgi:CP family cyanate transporter-like MFS transporter
MSLGGAVAAVVTQPLAAAAGSSGWRWALGVWAVLAGLAVLPWLAVRAPTGTSRAGHSAVRMGALRYSPTAIAMAVFFGLQSMEAYVVIGWSAQYLRDSGLSAGTAGLMLGINSVVVIPVNAVVPALTVRPSLQRPLLFGFMACYVVGWVGLWTAPRQLPWLWMALLAIGLGTFAMILALLGLRARTPETTAALSTVTQGWGYAMASAGPLLVGVLRGLPSGYTGMFVLVLAGVAGLCATGWLVTRPRYVDDEVDRSVPGWSPAAAGHDDAPLAASGEPPAAAPAAREEVKPVNAASRSA